MNLTAEMLAGFDAATSDKFDCPYYENSPSWAAFWFGHNAARSGPRDGVRSVSQSRGYTLRVTFRGGDTVIAPWPNAQQVRDMQARMRRESVTA